MVQRFGRTRRPRLQATASLIFALVAALILTPLQSAFAHSNHDHKMYVAPIGKDSGDCTQAWMPCRTIRYAIQQSTGKGSEVRVAAGDYFFDPEEGPLLFSTQVPVRGGYSLRDGFNTPNVLANPTFIAGFPARFRSQLAEIGFARVEDRVGREDPADVAPGASEKIYAYELANPTVRQDCIMGMAGIFPCRGIDFLGSVANNQFNSSTSGSNLWGHVDLNTGREYAVFGASRGTGVVDVTDPTNPVVIGTVPGNSSQWREIKVYQFYNQAENRWNAYAYASTESSTQGMQIIDLNHLSDPTPSVSLANTIGSDFTSSHTVYIKNVDYATNVALPGKTPILYYNGTKRNGVSQSSGLFRAFQLTNPSAPTLIGAPTGFSYTHDDTSMVITDSRTSACAPGHQASCEIMFDFSESSLDIWDVTNPAAPVRISTLPYSGSGYTHSGWYTDDKMYVFIQDELDETSFGHNSRVRTVNLANLASPTISATWDGPTAAIDHNGYTIGKKYYMSNYRRGLTILDTTNPNSLSERGFIDTFPSSDSANFNGAWGVYPYLPSRNLLISDIERGLIIVRESEGMDDEAIAGLDLTGTTPTILGDATLLAAATTTGTDVTYEWNYGDGTPVASGLGTVAHKYNTPGTYTVTVTATNPLGSQSDTTTITVLTAPDQEITNLNVTNDGPTTLGLPTGFSATIGSGTNVAYQWNFGDGSPVANGLATTSHTYAAAGNYTVTVTATNSVNTLSDTTSVTVVVPDQEITNLNVTNDGPTTLGSPTDFTATIGAGTNVTYQWNFGDGSPVTSGPAASASHTYAAVGDYTVTVTATNSVNTLSDTTSVTVVAAPEAITGLDVTNDGPTTLGATTTFTATVASGTDVVYTWDFGDGSPAANGPAITTHTYAEVGDYTVTVTASNSVNNVEDTTSVTVNALTPSFKNLIPLIMSILETGSQTAQLPATRIGGFGR